MDVDQSSSVHWSLYLRATQDQRCSWCTIVVHCLSENGLDIDSLSFFQYDEDAPYF